LFSLFATGVVDTGGKFAAGQFAAGQFAAGQFATGVVDTGGKFEMVLMGYSGAGGKLIHKKNQKQKIS
jgi:hypothetical protein